MCEGAGEHAREGKIRELGKNWVESVQGLQVDKDADRFMLHPTLILKTLCLISFG